MAGYTIDQLRQGYPDLTDDQIRRAILQTPGVELIEGPLDITPKGVTTPAIPVENKKPTQEDLDNYSGFFSAKGFGDSLVSLGQGIISTGEGFIGLVDLFTPGDLGKFVQEDILKKGFGTTSSDWKEWLQDLKSEEKQALEAQFAQAGGTDTWQDVADKISFIAENPSMLPGLITETLPTVFGGGILGKAATKLSAGKIAGVGAAATGEAAISGGMTQSQIREATEGGETTLEQDAIAATSGILTGIFGAAGAKMSKFLGIDDIDMLVSGQGSKLERQSIIKNAALSAASEGLEEFPQSMQEQAAFNLATGRPYMEGVFDEAATGAVAGLALGGGTGAYSQFKRNLSVGEINKAQEDAEKEKQQKEEEKKKESNTKGSEQTKGLDINGLPPELQTILGLETTTQQEQIDPNAPEQLDLFTETEGVTLPDIGDTIEWQITEKGDTATNKVSQVIKDNDGNTLGFITEKDEFGVNEFVPLKNLKNLSQETQNVTESTQQQDDGTSDELSSGPVGGDAQGTVRLDGTRVASRKVSTRPPRAREEQPTSPLEDFEYFEETDENGNITRSGFKRIDQQSQTVEEETLVNTKPILEIKAPNELKKGAQKDFYVDEAEDSEKVLSRQDTPPKYGSPYVNKKGEELEYIRTGSRYLDNSPEELSNNPAQARQAAVIHSAFDDVVELSDNLNKTAYDAAIKVRLNKKIKQIKADRQKYINRLKQQGISAKEAKQMAEKNYGTDYDITKEYGVTNPLSVFSEEELVDLYKKHSRAPSQNTKIKHPFAKKIRDAKNKFKEDFSTEEKQVYENKKGEILKWFVKGEKAKEGMRLGQSLKLLPNEIPDVELESVEEQEAEHKKRIENRKQAKNTEEKQRPKIVLVRDVLKDKLDKLINKKASITEILDEIKYKGPDIAKPTTAIGPDSAYQISAILLSKVIKSFNGNIKVRYGATINDRPAQFNPEKNEIVLNNTKMKNLDIGSVIVHEVTHFALDHILDKDNVKKLTPEQKNLVAELDRLTSIANRYLKMDLSLKEFVAETMSNDRFGIQLNTIPVQALFPRTKLDTAIQRVKSFVNRIASIYTGLFSYSVKGADRGTLAYVAAHIERILTGQDYKPATEDFRGQEVSFLPTEDEPTDMQNGAQQVQKMFGQSIDFKKKGMTRRFLSFLRSIVAPTQAEIDARKTTYQNSRALLKRLEKDLKDSGLINYFGDSANDFYNHMTNSKGSALTIKLTKLVPKEQAALTAIQNYANAMGVSMHDAISKLSSYMVALHEKERRHLLYLMSVPLSNNNIQIGTDANGNAIFDTPANLREKIMDAVLSDQVINMEQSAREELNRRLKDRLESLVAGYTDALGSSPSKKKSINELSDEYNAIAGIDSRQVTDVLAEYNADMRDNQTRDLVDNVMNSIKDLNKTNNEILREAGHWSSALDSVVEFYGFENHFPFKINTKNLSKETVADLSKFQYNGARFGSTGRDFYGEGLSGSLNEDIEAEDPIAQSFIDAGIAAARYGMSGFLSTFRNAVRDGLIDNAKIIKQISWKDRFKGEVSEDIYKRDNIFVHNPDGTIDIINIKNENLLAAVRTVAPDDHWWNTVTTVVGKATSFFGQVHTRFNIKFAPYNYVRDVLTNAFVVAGEIDALQASKFAAKAALNIINGNVLQSGLTFARLWQAKDMDGLERLAREDSFARSMLEYVQNGGAISVLQGVGAERAFEQLVSDVRTMGSKKQKLKEFAVKYPDIYMQMFEFSARTAAYEVLKPIFKQRIQEQYPGQAFSPELEAAAQREATAYTKNFTNFEEVGTAGRELGNWFMFYRPAATGAIRALDVIGPAIRSWDSVKAGLSKSILNNPEALRKRKEAFYKQKVRGTVLMMAMMGAGMALSAMQGGVDPEEFVDQDDPDRWIRNLRIDLGTDEKTGKPLVMQIPWGFGLGGLLAIGSQIYLKAVKGDSYSWGNFAGNLSKIVTDSYLPLPVSQLDPSDNTALWTLDTALPSVARPVLHYAAGVNAFGANLYRGGRYIGEFNTPANVPLIYSDVSTYIAKLTDGEFVPEPSVMHFLVNNYLDGIGYIWEGPNSAMKLITGDKYFDIDKDIPFIDSFISTKSFKEERDFWNAKPKIEALESKLRSLAEMDKATFDNYRAKNPAADLIVEYFNSESRKKLADLQKEKQDIITNEYLTDKERNAKLQNNRIAQRRQMEAILNQVNLISELKGDDKL